MSGALRLRPFALALALIAAIDAAACTRTHNASPSPKGPPAPPSALPKQAPNMWSYD